MPNTIRFLKRINFFVFRCGSTAQLRSTSILWLWSSEGIQSHFNAEIPSTVPFKEDFITTLSRFQGKFQVQKSLWKDQTCLTEVETKTMTQTAGVELIPFWKSILMTASFCAYFRITRTCTSVWANWLPMPRFQILKNIFVLWTLSECDFWVWKTCSPMMFGSSFVDAIWWNIWKGSFCCPSAWKSDVWLSSRSRRAQLDWFLEIMTELHRRYKKLF